MLTHLIVGLGFNTQHVQETSCVHHACVLLQKVNMHGCVYSIGKHVHAERI